MRKNTLPYFVALVSTLSIANVIPLVDRFIHPEIPYFSTEHVIIAVAWICLAAISGAMFTTYLRNARQRPDHEFRCFIESAPDALITVDSDGKIVFFNESAEHMFGYPHHEVYGKPIEFLMSHRHLERHVTARRAWIQSGESQPMAKGAQPYALRKDGVEFPIACNLTRVAIEDSVLTVALVRDVRDQVGLESELRALEVEIRRGHRLEEIGALARDFAHDFNNMLAASLNYADLALVRDNSMHAVRDSIEKIKALASNMSSLCQQIFAYTNRREITTEPASLSLEIEKMIRLLRLSISKKATLKCQLSENLPSIEASASQIQQVVMNLIINASEALEMNEGTIIIETGVINTKPPLHAWTYEIGDLPDGGPCVYLEISDSGCGMDAEVQARMFDPFFTTKFERRGLGMMVVVNIVRVSGGSIKINSQSGIGTTILVLFPLRDGTGNPASPELGGRGSPSDPQRNDSLCR